MEKREMLAHIEQIIEEAKAAVLATVDEKGLPRMRWMTPAILRGREGAIFAVASRRSAKVKHLSAKPNGQWIFQSPALDRVAVVDCKVNIVDNPSIRSEVLEVVGSRLRAFWKMYEQERDLLVLETIIERAQYYLPMKGVKESVSFT
ncbi:MAG: pyridoxamine 5'-phosphate oxidase family protein [Spirochaetota bacterium]|nr:MAG: pyridoxamine 5'-phosphate oxidase family protein [Spirochaetota bacterium]